MKYQFTYQKLHQRCIPNLVACSLNSIGRRYKTTCNSVIPLIIFIISSDCISNEWSTHNSLKSSNPCTNVLYVMSFPVKSYIPPTVKSMQICVTIMWKWRDVLYHPKLSKNPLRMVHLNSRIEDQWTCGRPKLGTTIWWQLSNVLRSHIIWLPNEL